MQTRYPRVIWRPTTSNSKLGVVPTATIGETLEETIASCDGCPLLPTDACFAQKGLTRSSLPGLQAAHAKGAPGSLRYALAARRVSARIVRISTIGDAGRIDPIEAIDIQRAVASEGLSIVGYTHHWREAGAAVWRGVLRASCETPADADAAVDAGWTATTLLPRDADVTPGALRTPAGRKIVVCPNQTLEKRGKLLQCNECRLCASSVPPVIGFLAHGADGVAHMADRIARGESIATLLEERASKKPAKPRPRGKRFAKGGADLLRKRGLI